MFEHRNFFEEFRKLLDSIPPGTTLTEYQYAYRKVIFSMGLRILEKFPEDAVGPPPRMAEGAMGGAGGGRVPANPDKGTGGSGGGIHPNLCDFSCYVLGVQPNSGP